MAAFGDAGREAHDDLTERVLRGPSSTRQRSLLFGKRWLVARMGGMPLPCRVRRRFTRLVRAGVEFDRIALGLGLKAPERGIGVDLPRRVARGRCRSVAASALPSSGQAVPMDVDTPGVTLGV